MGLRRFFQMIFPALKRWAIFGRTAAEHNYRGASCRLDLAAPITRLLWTGRERDNLRRGL
jgi:hypothetical protein